MGRKLCEMTHVFALAIWLGSLVMSGAVAAQLFPLLKALDARVPDHEAFTGDQWLIVAGRVGDMVFQTTDLIQFAAVFAAIATLVASIAWLGLPMRRISTLVRSLALGVALLLVAYQLFVLGPAMQGDLHAYWTAAHDGDNALAQIHREAFGDRHPQASRVLGATVGVVLLALGAAVWSLINHAGTDTYEHKHNTKNSGSA